MKYKINDMITVSVTSIVPYGVFVKTNNEYTGLIHISEIDGSINNFKVNEDIKARIIGIDKKNKQLSLSMKKNSNNHRKNTLREVGTGFDELKDNLPKWIDETIKELENSK